MEPQEYDEIIRNLARIAAHQDLINERLLLAIDRLTLGQERLEGIVQRLEVILQAIRDILGRGNGRP